MRTSALHAVVFGSALLLPSLCPRVASFAKAASNEAYYASLTPGATGKTLRDELHRLIYPQKKDPGYSGVWNVYKTADIRPDGKIMDIYSNVTNYVPGTDQDKGSHPNEGASYNREHCIPKSWWGGVTSNQGSDPFIVLPSDAYVNGVRSNYPYGEIASPSYSSANGYSLFGSSALPGVSGNVFEPNDEWKGDLARVHFYALACYDDAPTWTAGDGRQIFSGSFSSGHLGLTNYAHDLFLRWHELDPVSPWEKQRNDLVEKHTNNRNPFIDRPEYVSAIWENKIVDPAPAETLKLDRSSLSLTLGENAQLVATSDAPSKISWAISSPIVSLSKTATSSGEALILTAEKSGNATITASVTTSKGTILQQTCAISVGAPASPIVDLTLRDYQEVATFGEPYDPGNYRLFALHEDGSEEEVTASSELLAFPDTKMLGKQTLTLSYSNRRKDFPVKVTNVGAIQGEDAPATKKTYAHTFAKEQFCGAQNGTAQLSNVPFAFDFSNAGYFGFDSARGFQIGSGKKPAKNIRLSTSHFASFPIESVEIDCCGGSSVKATLQVSISGQAIGTAQALSGTSALHSFGNPSSPISGELAIEIQQTTSKAIYLKSLTIHYQEGGAGSLRFTSSEQAEAYAALFLRSTDASCAASSAPSALVWEELQKEYEAMVQEAKDLFSPSSSSPKISESLARYRIIVEKYGMHPFLGRAAQGALLLSASNSNDPTALLLLLSLLPIASFAFYRFGKRRQK